jgi:hypothetical protein
MTFDINLKNILVSGSVIIKVIMCKKKKLVRIIAYSRLVRFHSISYRVCI